AAQNLITAAVVKLYASRLFITKVRIRSNRMWLECPKHDSELGEEFYGERFQNFLKLLQKKAESRFQLIQKDDKVRFVIHEIAGLEEAAGFLKGLLTTRQKETSMV